MSTENPSRNRIVRIVLRECDLGQHLRLEGRAMEAMCEGQRFRMPLLELVPDDGRAAKVLDCTAVPKWLRPSLIDKEPIK